MTEIDLDQARRLMDRAVDAIKAVYDPDRTRRRAEEMRKRNPGADPLVFDLMERVARAEDALFLLRLDLYHVANLHPVEIPTGLIRELVSAHHVVADRSATYPTKEGSDA